MVIDLTVTHSQDLPRGHDLALAHADRRPDPAADRPRVEVLGRLGLAHPFGLALDTDGSTKEIRQVGSLRILRLFTFQFSLLLMGDGIGLLVLFDNNDCPPAVFCTRQVGNELVSPIK